MKVEGDWARPYGFWLHLTHKEACTITKKDTVDLVLAALPTAWWAAIVAAAIYFQAQYIREKNQKSGKKGVRLFFNIPVGVFTHVERKGKGASPCSGSIPNPTERAPKIPMTAKQKAIEQLRKETNVPPGCEIK